MVDKKQGRPKIYQNRTVEAIALPLEAKEKADELRGQKPLTQFLGEIVCSYLGVGGINAK